MDPNRGATQLTSLLLRLAKDNIPTVHTNAVKCSHPWVNQKVIDLVAAKHASENTPNFQATAAACSQGLLEEHNKYVAETRRKLCEMKPGSKQWWRKSRTLMNKPITTSSVPPLQRSDGSWVKTSKEKADILATSFAEK